MPAQADDEFPIVQGVPAMSSAFDAADNNRPTYLLTYALHALRATYTALSLPTFNPTAHFGSPSDGSSLPDHAALPPSRCGSTLASPLASGCHRARIVSELSWGYGLKIISRIYRDH
ncbi:hypothetical protein Skr01_54220 [Sphaerisporangium krabiense]|nr:hypothetical protein Skr01_54220 [Sphaerisporangium krabiense]